MLGGTEEGGIGLPAQLFAGFVDRLREGGGGTDEHSSLWDWTL